MRCYRQSAAVCLVLGLALALRLYALAQRPIWYDEAFSIFLAERDWGQILAGTVGDIQPPLYYFALHLWLVLGESIFVVRFLSVAFSLLCVALVYALARRLLSQRAALIAALLTAIAPFQIYYAQELRMYALLELGLLAYVYGVVKLERGERTAGTFIWIALSGAAALYAQSLAVLFWIAPDLYALLRRNWKLLKDLAFAQGASLVLFAPWLAVLVGQFSNIQRSYWTTPPGVAEALQMLIAFTFNQPLPAWFLPVGLFVTVALDAILALRLARNIRRSAPAELVLLTALLLVPPLLMFALSHAVRSVFAVRALIACSAVYAILVGWLIGRIRSGVAQTAIVGVAVVMATAVLIWQFSYGEFPRSPFQAADAFLSANTLSGDVVLHDNKLSFFPMHFYERSLAQDWLADPPSAGSNTLSAETMDALGIFPRTVEQTERVGRVWFVIFQRALDEATAEGHPQGNMAWMDANFHQVTVMRFNDLNLYLYQK